MGSRVSKRNEFCDLYTKYLNGSRWLDTQPRGTEYVWRYLLFVCIPLAKGWSCATAEERREYMQIVKISETLGCNGVKYREVK